MKQDLCMVALLCLSLGPLQSAVAAADNSPLGKFRSDAESKGYIFYTNHDQIVSEAKKEGNLNVMTGLAPESIERKHSLCSGRLNFLNDWNLPLRYETSTK